MVRCVPLNSDYKGLPTILVSFIEVLICILSVSATWKHFKSAGRRLSNIAWFHLSHSGFCIVYATFNFTLYYVDLKICTCDPFMILSCVYISCFLYMWVIFLKYWDITTRHKTSRENHHRQAEVRVAVYSSICAAYFGTVIYFTIYEETCEDKSFEEARSIIIYLEILCLTLESSKIALSCVAKFAHHYSEYQNELLAQQEDEESESDNDSATSNGGYVSLSDPVAARGGGGGGRLSGSSSFAQLSDHHLSVASAPLPLSTRGLIFKPLYWELVQTLAFVSLPLSLITGFIMRAHIVKDHFDESTYPIYLYLFPSIVMLCIMWQRHYITISGKTPQELEFDWLSDSEHDSSSNHRTSLIRPSSLYVVPVLPSNSSPHISNGLLSRTVPPSSSINTAASSPFHGDVINDGSNSLTSNALAYNQRNLPHHPHIRDNNYLEGFDSKSRVGQELAEGLIRVEPLHSAFNFVNTPSDSALTNSSSGILSENGRGSGEGGGDSEKHEQAFANMFMPATPVKATSSVDTYVSGASVSGFNPNASLLPPSSQPTVTIGDDDQFDVFSPLSGSGMMFTDDVETSSSDFFACSSSIKVIEDLRPPYAFLSLSYHFMSSIVLPSLEKALTVHNKRLKDLLEVTSLNNTLNTSGGSDHQPHNNTSSSIVSASTPNAQGLRLTRSSSLYSNLEMDRQHYELQRKCDDLKLKFVKFVLELRDIVNTMPLPQQHHYYANMFEDIAYMKQSAKKKVPSLAYFATNLQIHKTRLFYQVNEEDDDQVVVDQCVDNDNVVRQQGAKLHHIDERDTTSSTTSTRSSTSAAAAAAADQDQDQKDRSSAAAKKEVEAEGGNETATSKRISYNINSVKEHVITSITFGAPSAHSLGFKNGGLRETMEKLTQYYLPPQAKTSRLGNTPDLVLNPDTLLKQLELRYECRAREAIVTSQALSAVTSAALELLSRIIYKKQAKDMGMLLQFHKVGLLVHCISLLSTSGNELSMLDDFAGALERLDITLKFHPPDTATFQGGDPFKKKKFTSSINSNHLTRGGGGSSPYSLSGRSRGDSSVDGLRSGYSSATTASGYSSSANSSQDCQSMDGAEGRATRKTDPLNLLSVIKIKPTKFKSPTSTAHTETISTKEGTSNAAASNVGVKADGASSTLPPFVSSSASNPLDSVFGSPMKSMIDIENNTETLDETNETKEEKDHGDEEEEESTTETSPGKQKYKPNRSSKNASVLLGRVTIDIQVNSMSSYEWLCETLDIPVTKISAAAAASIQKQKKKHSSQNQSESLENDKQQKSMSVAPTIKLIPVLFNLGVNEMQSIANVVGNTSMQTEINRKGLGKMKNYFNLSQLAQEKLNKEYVDKHKLGALNSSNQSFQVSSGGLGGGVGSGPHRDIAFFSDEVKIPLLLNSIEFLVEAVAKEKGKIVDLLLVSSFAARLMNGARTTSCKSAKDRTSVFHTLEVARLAERMGWLERSKEIEFLDELRGFEGVRLQNCITNIGKPMYSFNSVQLKALPRELRPPVATASAGGET